ncbi:hypothetical protein [Streptomyces sp. JJ38]|uniref:hypothetical protein n=1 Tax=Streptomyces sp. JJ38 TaxID=2738128 RepID=UPI001C5596B7|nr:hypothetical protein [Streptomyces sp. JJ38]MBW1599975.1 hypothetical protein [Streptomyces sp. JJ38]
MNRATRRTALAAAATALALGGVTATAAPASATSVTFASVPFGKDGSRALSVGIDGDHAGWVTFSSDPYTTTNGTYYKGDTLYVSDKRTDGFAIRGYVERVSNWTSTHHTTTHGLKAPVRVSDTNNIKEGTRLRVKACVAKGSKIIKCSGWYGAHA